MNGWSRFAALVRAWQWPLTILAAGLVWYLRSTGWGLVKPADAAAVTGARFEAFVDSTRGQLALQHDAIEDVHGRTALLEEAQQSNDRFFCLLDRAKAVQALKPCKQLLRDYTE